MKIEAKHSVRKAEVTVKARRDEVFPLLCPVREYEWIPKWRCELVHCPEGAIGPDTVFTTQPEGLEARETWALSRYEPESYRLAFMRFIPGVCITRMEIGLRETQDGDTLLACTKTLTALGEAGHPTLDALTPREHEYWLSVLGSLLDAHFQKTRP